MHSMLLRELVVREAIIQCSLSSIIDLIDYVVYKIYDRNIYVNNTEGEQIKLTIQN